MRVLITGSRDIPAILTHDVQQPIWLAVRDAVYVPTPVVIVEGGCPTGADMMARDLVEDLSFSYDGRVSSETHPAYWDTHGKAAGPIRNQQMVNLGADLCLAFFMEGAGNRGTTDCANRAEAAGIPVRRITVGIVTNPDD